jgi:hypothetical protein
MSRMILNETVFSKEEDTYNILNRVIHVILIKSYLPTLSKIIISKSPYLSSPIPRSHTKAVLCVVVCVRETCRRLHPYLNRRLVPLRGRALLDL